MFSFNLTKFFAAAVLCFLLFSGCRTGSNSGDVNSSQTPLADDLKSEIPFSTKEPEQFQTEIVITTDGAERKTFVARNGANHRYDFNFGAKNQVTMLSTDKNYQIAPARRIYTEYVGGLTIPTDDWTKFLTSQWLNDKQSSNFEKLETVENLTKYRVHFSESDASEVFVYIDEKTGLPMKQEFYSSGAQKILLYTVELKNLKLETDANLFTVPADFRRVSTEEFSNIVWSDKN